MKPIKTTHHYKGNKYGRISKHSAIERMYSVELSDGKLLLEDHFSTLRGANFAIMLMTYHAVEECFFTYGDWDSVADIYYAQRTDEQKEAYLNKVLTDR